MVAAKEEQPHEEESQTGVAESQPAALLTNGDAAAPEGAAKQEEAEEAPAVAPRTVFPPETEVAGIERVLHKLICDGKNFRCPKTGKKERRSFVPFL